MSEISTEGNYKPIPCSKPLSCAHIELPRKLDNVVGKISWIKHSANYPDWENSENNFANHQEY
jgi:hypothetical protein